MTLGLKHRALRALGHAPPFKGKDRIIRLLAHPDRHPPTTFEAPFFGRVYPGDLSNFLDWRVYFYGAYSHDELALLSDIAEAMRPTRANLTFYDVGANVGHHSLFMSGLVDQVHSFEPFAPVAAKIRQKVDRNGLANLRLHPLALSDSDGTADFSAPVGANQGTGSLVHAVGETVEVPISRGDGYFAAEALPRIDILKMDVEGHESAVLAGLRGRLLADRPVILTEISGPGRSGFVSDAGFRAALYPDHLVFGVAPMGDRYTLGRFDLASAHEVLIVPAEEAGLRSALGV